MKKGVAEKELVRKKKVFLSMVLMLIVLASPQPIQATTAIRSVSLQLAPVVHGVKAQRAVGEFFRRVCRVNVTDGAVWLAASDVGGALETDDAVRMEVERADGGRAIWKHDYRNSATGGIAPLAATQMTDMFTPGMNIVTITLMDLLPPRHSSTAYVLSFDAPVDAPESECASDAALLRMPVVEKRSMVEAAVIASATPRATSTSVAGTLPPPAGTPIAVPISPARLLVPTQVSQPNVQPAVSDDRIGVAGVLAIMGIVGAVALMIVLLCVRERPVLSGLLTVHDRGTGQRLEYVDLVQFGRSASILLEPLQIQSGALQTGTGAAKLYADERGGCVLAGSTCAARVLRDGDAVQIGDRLRVTYRAPLAALPALSAEAS
ncbi:MAG: hypothetical protein NTZ50_11935 [Chloroflexi bacterium]|nr:hypothetical protein [Chloroflexota bacterium]